MGVTIHFEGQLRNEAAYQQLLEEVSSIAKAEGWASEAIESRVTTLSRVRDEQDRDYACLCTVAASGVLREQQYTFYAPKS